MASKFSLRLPESAWIIDGVNYKNKFSSYNLSQKLLPSRTQDEHAEQRRKAKSNEFYLESMPFYHTLFTTLYDHKEDKDFKNGVEEARQFIKESMFKTWLLALTRPIYNPVNKKDLIIHDYKQPKESRIRLDSIIGPDSYILDENAKNVKKPLQSLLGTRQNLQEINNIYKWLVDGDLYLFRVNETPKKSLETVAGFIVYSDRAGLYCYWDPAYSSAGLGVRREKI